MKSGGVGVVVAAARRGEEVARKARGRDWVAVGGDGDEVWAVPPI